MMPWILSGICVLSAAAVVIWERCKTKKTMETLNQMISRAMDGNFQESSFDESLLSALETRFANYLAASAISAQNVASEKDRIKSLIGDISHQTKTPIANLLLYTELLEEENLTPQAQEYAHTLHAQAAKLQFLIDSLVKLSRLENGILTLSPSLRDLQPLLQCATRQFASKAQAKGLQLIFQDTPVQALLDEKWTAEAVCNLLDNAIKYTDSGSITVSVTAYQLFARIDIADTGRGIPESEQAKIFSRFYRSESDGEGVGIGLYLAREIVSREGGYIKVSSQPGKGSVFSIFLPLLN